MGFHRTRHYAAPSALFLCFFLLFLSVTGIGAQTRLVIAHTSDIHGFIAPQPDPFAGDGERRLMGGFASLQTFLHHSRAKAQEQDATFLYLDSADYFQGTAVVDHHRGACMMGLFNEVGLSATSMGNHEFDYGLPWFAQLSEAANFPIICANVFLKGSGRRPEFVVPCHIFKAGDLEVAVIGVLTPETMGITLPKNVAAIDILDPGPIANALALEAREGGADFVILLSHCGLESDQAMAENLFGIDLVLGGHSHSHMEQIQYRGPGRVPVIHPGCHLTHVNEILIDIGGPLQVASMSVRHVPLYLDEWPEDPSVKASVASYEAGIAGMKRILGTATVEINAGVIGGDSPEGSWVADAMREAANADFAFINFGGLRRPIFKGPITVEDIFQLQPFDNAIEVLTLTGSQVVDLVERSLSPKFLPVDADARDVAIKMFRLDPEGLRREMEGYGYLVPANLHVTFDPERAAMNRIVTITTLSGQPLDLEKSYRVALNSYVAGGGDGYSYLTKHPLREPAGTQVREAVIAKAERDGGIRAVPGPRLINLKLKVVPWQKGKTLE